MEHVSRYLTILSGKEPIGEIPVFVDVNLLDRHNLRTVEERMLGRHEQVCQQVLLTAGENDVYIRHKLNDGADIGIGSDVRYLPYTCGICNKKDCYKRK